MISIYTCKDKIIFFTSSDIAAWEKFRYALFQWGHQCAKNKRRTCSFDVIASSIVLFVRYIIPSFFGNEIVESFK